ncbi:hypothetical protein ACLOJK_022667, partial [Asimina triloba]
IWAWTLVICKLNLPTVVCRTIIVVDDLKNESGEEMVWGHDRLDALLLPVTKRTRLSLETTMADGDAWPRSLAAVDFERLLEIYCPVDDARYGSRCGQSCSLG